LLSFTYLPAMNTAFGSQPIGPREWGLIPSASLVVYIVTEFEKWIRRRKSA
jgi:Ca2+-transporting ATPase